MKKRNLHQRSIIIAIITVVGLYVVMAETRLVLLGLYLLTAEAALRQVCRMPDASPGSTSTLDHTGLVQD